MGELSNKGREKNCNGAKGTEVYSHRQVGETGVTCASVEYFMPVSFFQPLKRIILT
jgi:hypothetical protein